MNIVFILFVHKVIIDVVQPGCKASKLDDFLMTYGGQMIA